MKKLLLTSIILSLTACSTLTTTNDVSNKDLKKQIAIQDNVKQSQIKISDRRSDDDTIYFTASIKGHKKSCQATTYAQLYDTSRKIGALNCSATGSNAKKECNALLKADGQC